MSSIVLVYPMYEKPMRGKSKVVCSRFVIDNDTAKTEWACSGLGYTCVDCRAKRDSRHPEVNMHA